METRGRKSSRGLICLLLAGCTTVTVRQTVPPPIDSVNNRAHYVDIADRAQSERAARLKAVDPVLSDSRNFSSPALNGYHLVLSAGGSVLVNLSSRAEVGTAGVVVGFVVQGGASETVLLRGIGPALAGYGVTDALADPALVLYDSTGAIIASDLGWSNSPVGGPSVVAATVSAASAATMAAVGAFTLPAGSGDCAMVVSLPAGAYTANVGSVSGGLGTVLVEIYQLPSE